MRLIHRLSIAAAMAGIFCCLAFGQAVSTATLAKPTYYAPATVPSQVRQVVTSLGDRVQKPGKEQVVMTGTLSQQGTISTAQIIRQLPGYLRIDESGGKTKSLSFDLTTLAGSSAVDSSDQDLVESIESDSAESFLAKFGSNAAVRHLGDLFRVKGETGFGAQVDIYEVVAPDTVKSNKQAVNYMFDSGTGLLRRVAYTAQQSGKTVVVQTVLSNYSAVGVYSLPGRISRLVDGVEVLSFTRVSATVSGQAAVGVFAVSVGGK